MAGALAVAVLAAAGLGTSLAWERGERSTLGQRTRQLGAVESVLASTQASLAAQGRRTVALQAEVLRAARQWATLKAQLAQADNELLETRGELGQAQGQVDQAQSQVDRAQSQVAQAQSRADRAQSQVDRALGQLGHAQLELSAAQSRAAECQQGASLGQQTAQLLAALAFVENAYLTAAESKDTPRAQLDLNQVRALDVQAQALVPGFSASVQVCTSGR
jgi:chromosome segregation ATPase